MFNHFRIFVILFFVLITAHANGECPKGVDPTYCKVAEQTGGKVFTNPEDLTHYLEQEALREKIYSRIRQIGEVFERWAFCLPILAPFLAIFLASRLTIPRIGTALLFGAGCVMPSVVLYLMIQSAGGTLTSLYTIFIGLTFITATCLVYFAPRNRVLLFVWATVCSLLPYTPMIFVINIH